MIAVEFGKPLGWNKEVDCSDLYNQFNTRNFMNGRGLSLEI